MLATTEFITLQYWSCHFKDIYFDNQQSQTPAKLLLKSITRASGEQLNILALRIKQMARKAYVNNATDLRNEWMTHLLKNSIHN